MLKWSFWLPFGATILNLTAAIYSITMATLANLDNVWLCLIIGAAAAILCAIIGFYSWHARGQSIIHGDWDELLAVRDANKHLTRLSVDLLENLNGDLVGVWQRNKLALSKLGYWREL